MTTSAPSRVTTGPPAGRRGGGRAARTRRLPLGLAAALVALGGVGAIYQALATERDRRAYPPPGRLVDVGGRRLHLLVMGGQDRDGPAVILEAGMASFSPNWHWVQTELAPTTRVVAYDRAGLGWSDPGPAPRDARRIADELRAALRAAGIPPPYVLAGHSFGGLPARAFADRYPDEVVGLVLADAAHPDQWARWPTPHADLMIAAAQQVTSWLARLGLLRVVDPSAAISAGLPPRQVGELRARTALPGAAATVRAQLLAWRTASRAQVNNARSLGALPLVVLGVGEQPLGGETLTALQAELPALSTNSTRRVVPGATHESLLARREDALVVVEAIRQVLAAARAGRPLAPAAPGWIEARR